MEKKSSTFLFRLFIISCLYLASTRAKNTLKRQTDALDNLYKAKFFNKDNYHSTIDTSLFMVNDENDKKYYMPKITEKNNLREGDKIERLPGQPHVRFDQYGGYVTVDEKAGRAFYYYFVEAEKAKHSKPLLLWLNGGPGCSSLAYGAMEELGPFRVHSDGKTLYENQYAGNHAANVLFLESPAGVGFSYSNTSADIESGGDRKTAEDNTVFVLNWLERFPEYKDRDFYIAGESYAGHYVPQLAHNILLHNKKANKTLINLKGILIGNAVINDETDTIGMYEYFNSHAIVSDEITSQIKKTCNFSGVPISHECTIATIAAEIATINIDIYNIYYRTCHNVNVTAKPMKASVLDFDPCSDSYIIAYLNNPQVQKALHANVTGISYGWQPCNDLINWKDSPSTIIPLLQEFMENGLRVWVFSGDTDGRVPVTSTQYSLKKMNLTIKTPYHPWYLHKEVGGYTEVYKEGLTFATVRGAGHQVPSYQPARALSLITHFLDDTPLANKP